MKKSLEPSRMLRALLVSCFHEYLSQLLCTGGATSQLSDLLHNFVSHKLPPSKYRLFCLSQCDKPSSFNNCLFDISCSIKRFSNVTFPYAQAFACLPLLDQWLCQVRKWRVEWRTWHSGLSGWYFANEMSDSLSPAHRMQKIPRASDFTDKAGIGSFQWCHLVMIRRKAQLSPPQ